MPRPLCAPRSRATSAPPLRHPARSAPRVPPCPVRSARHAAARRPPRRSDTQPDPPPRPALHCPLRAPRPRATSAAPLRHPARSAPRVPPLLSDFAAPVALQRLPCPVRPVCPVSPALHSMRPAVPQRQPRPVRYAPSHLPGLPGPACHAPRRPAASAAACPPRPVAPAPPHLPRRTCPVRPFCPALSAIRSSVPQRRPRPVRRATPPRPVHPHPNGLALPAAPGANPADLIHNRQVCMLRPIDRCRFRL